MKNYKISLGGRGSEIFVFELNDDQFEQLEEGNVQHEEMSYDDVCKILGVESYFDGPNPSVIGSYPEAFYMVVTDEEGKIVYEQEDFDYENYKSENIYCENKKYLLIEDYCKGEQNVYRLVLEEDFDINKLEFVVTEVGNKIDFITGITYNDKSYEDCKDIGDFWSKGYYYHLVNY